MFTKWKRHYRELSIFRKRLYKLIFAFIILLFISAIVYVFLPRQVSVTGEKIVYAPKDIIYNTANENRVIRQILPFFKFIDPVKDSVIVTDYGKQVKMVFKKRGYPGEFVYQTTRLIPYRKIIQKLTCGNVVYKAQWDFRYINDTTTKVLYAIHGRTDFWHKIQLLCLSNKIKKNLDAARVNVVREINKTLKGIHFKEIGVVSPDSLLYLYKEVSATKGDWRAQWEDNFAKVLLYAIRNKAYDKNRKLFNLFYFKSKDSLMVRACTPLAVPIKTENNVYHCDSLYVKNYYAFEYNGPYEYLPYMMIKADSVLKAKELESDPERPVIEQFLVGHTQTADEMQWKTRLLIPVKNK